MTNSTSTTAISGTVFLIGGLISFVVWIVILWATVHIAGTKQRSKFGWGVFAFFFSWIALLIVALLGPNPKATPSAAPPAPPTTV